MQMNEVLEAMVLTELEDAVGKENCSVKQIDTLTHSVDYYWISRMWVDREERCRKLILWLRQKTRKRRPK